MCRLLSSLTTCEHLKAVPANLTDFCHFGIAQFRPYSNSALHLKGKPDVTFRTVCKRTATGSFTAKINKNFA
jgi:hypothetical protein